MNALDLVPTHFEQLKELRNGTISYIQIIKRDQTRPPVRPVCRKLGVTKLSEIKSEADLYEALVCVAQGQSQKAKEQEAGNFHNNFTENGGRNNYDLSDRSNGSPDYYHGKLMGSNSPYSGRSNNTPSNLDASYGPSSPYDPCLTPEFKNVLECVLHIRVAWDPRDRSQRLDYFSYQFGLDEGFLLDILKRICESLSCIHLSPQIDVDLVVQATKMCYRQLMSQKKLSNSYGGSISSRSEYSQSNVSSSRQEFSRVVDTRIAPNLMDTYHSARLSSPGSTFSPTGNLSPSNSPRILEGSPSGISSAPRLGGTSIGFNPSPRYVNDDMSTGSNGRNPNGMMKVTSQPFNSSQYHNRSLPSPNNYRYPQDTSDNGERFDRSKVPTNSLDVPGLSKLFHQGMSMSTASSTIRQGFQPSIISKPNANMDQLNFFSCSEYFWEHAAYLFSTIANVDEKCHKSIAILKELIDFVETKANFSLLYFVALDCVLRRAVMEICSKVDKIANDGSSVVDTTVSENMSLCATYLAHFVNSANAQQAKEYFKLSSEVLLQNLMNQLEWCPSSESKSFEAHENVEKSFLRNTSVVTAIDKGLGQLESEVFLDISTRDIVEHVRLRLQTLLDNNQRGPAIEDFGAVLTSLGNNDCLVTDFLAHYGETEMYENECQNTKKESLRRIAVLESALVHETQFDIALKHLQHCLIDFKLAIKDIMKSKFNNHLNQTSNLGSDDDDAFTRSKNLSQLTLESETMSVIGDRFLEKLVVDVQSRRKQPQLKALIEQLSILKTQLNEIAMSIEMVKTQTLLNLSSTLGKCGYYNVQINKKFDDPIIRFADSDTFDKPFPCAIVLNRSLYPYSSRLIAAYYNADVSGKIKLFAGIVQHFVRDNGLNEELSSYAWNVMIIHFLLRFNYLENLQTHETLLSPTLASYPSQRVKVNDVDVTFAENVVLSPTSQERVNQTPLTEFLFYFFEYFTFESDVFGNAFTLRGKGQVIPKAGWSKFKSKASWRLLLEDPFETGMSENPNDLGSHLTFVGQAKIFKHIRMAYYALLGLATHSKDQMDDACVFYLSKEKLAYFASKGGFSVDNVSTAPTSSPFSRSKRVSEKEFVTTSEFKNGLLSNLSNAPNRSFPLDQTTFFNDHLAGQQSFLSSQTFDFATVTQHGLLNDNEDQPNFAHSTINSYNDSLNGLGDFPPGFAPSGFSSQNAIPPGFAPNSEFYQQQQHHEEDQSWSVAAPNVHAQEQVDEYPSHRLASWLKK